MLLTVNGTAGVILFTLELAALGTRNFAVGFGSRFVAGDFGFPLLQVGRFFRSQCTRGNALVNALLLIDLTLVNAGRCGWVFGCNRRGGCLGKGGRANGQSQSSDKGLNLHDVSFLNRLNNKT